MNNPVYCEKCGAQMVPTNPDLPIGMTCPDCGWNWATSYVDPMLSDETIYSITITECDSSQAKVISILSKTSGLNLIQTKEAIKSLPFVAFNGKAPDVKNFISKFDELNITYKISPDFPY